MKQQKEILANQAFNHGHIATSQVALKFLHLEPNSKWLRPRGKHCNAANGHRLKKGGSAVVSPVNIDDDHREECDPEKQAGVESNLDFFATPAETAVLKISALPPLTIPQQAPKKERLPPLSFNIQTKVDI